MNTYLARRHTRFLKKNGKTLEQAKDIDQTVNCTINARQSRVVEYHLTSTIEKGDFAIAPLRPTTYVDAMDPPPMIQIIAKSNLAAQKPESLTQKDKCFTSQDKAKRCTNNR